MAVGAELEMKMESKWFGMETGGMEMALALATGTGMGMELVFCLACVIWKMRYFCDLPSL